MKGRKLKLAIQLDDNQRQALTEMHNGCILNGGVGSGKTRTALAYYHCIVCGGRIRPRFVKMTKPIDLYVITTAATRDKGGWEREMVPFLLYSSTEGYKNDGSNTPYPNLKVRIDSWNNIKKYVGVSGAFFIFDEDRVTGSGPWVRAFLKIAKANQWILLSATPGDRWVDYAPVFIANGFYKNITEFREQHIVWKRVGYGSGRDIGGYYNTRRLERLRDRILVDLPVDKDTVRHDVDVECQYDRGKYREIMRTRWDKDRGAPIDNASGLCQCLRKVVNSDVSRVVALMDILDQHPTAIIFYNYNYELDILRKCMEDWQIEYGEWNGQKHQDIPNGDEWCYLVQYGAAEGWNCTRTDTMIFFSQNYSYKVMEQARGRIDRRDTSFVDLYYYHLKSKAPIDLAIQRSVREKKIFNEGRYFNRIGKEEKKA